MSKIIEYTKKIGGISGGIVGSPPKASKEKGKKYHEHLVKRYLEVLEKI
ncbi:unnamed protein product [marine sediment metagenome]|uniref:Uncharacterized protein n=1 Tax=marine sediment metagenome TaxID=412755 RepID=X0S3S2_9ZZZZ